MPPQGKTDDEPEFVNDSDNSENPNPGQNPNNSPNPQTHIDDGNTQSPFSHPALKGLSEEDIAARIALSTSTIKSQGKRLTALEQELKNRAASVGTGQDVDAVPSDIKASDFWSSPHEVLPKLIEPMIAKQLKAAVGPLLADLQVNRQVSAWQAVANKYEDFDNFKDYVAETIREFGIESPSAELIESVYKMGVGEAAISGNYNRANRGGNTGGGGNGTPATPQRMNPQHRPSGHPSAQGNQPNNKPRELTEEERAFARMQGFKTDADYLAWADLEEHQVADAALGEDDK